MATTERLKFYTVESLGPKQSLTKENFLLCEEVPIARTGTQLYGAGEIPVEAGPDGTITVERNADEVFKPVTLDSFNGKPIVDGHPQENGGTVDTDNWARLSKGVVLNVRRGEGLLDDFIVADLLITDAAMIEDVRSRDKVQVSAGYDADYVQFAPGRAAQINILGNHLAIVPKARCGTRCSIGDSAPEPFEPLTNTRKGKRMAFTKKTIDALNKAFEKKDAEAHRKILDEASEEASGDSTHIHVHNAPEAAAGGVTKDEFDAHKLETSANHQKCMDAIADLDKRKEDRDSDDDEGDEDKTGDADEDETEEEKKKRLAAEAAEKKTGDKKAKDSDKQEEADRVAEAPDGEEDKAKKTKDSALFQPTYASTVALAEIIAPGIKFKTMDSAAAPRKTFDSMCDLRRRALVTAIGTDGALINAMRGKTTDAATVGKLTCDSVRNLFHSVGEAKRALNVANATRSTSFVGDAALQTGAVKVASIADINAANRAHYDKN